MGSNLFLTDVSGNDVKAMKVNIFVRNLELKAGPQK